MFNQEQAKAVATTKGRVLVLAGAGSGKTSVLIGRCVHLINNCNVSPSSILGLTFTNKAASEMRQRITKKIGKEKAGAIVLSTFHSFCLSILKKEIHHLGYTREFSIYDERDVERLSSNLQKQITENEKLEEVLARSMKAYNAVDFDGLLSLTVQLFKNHPEVLEKYQTRFEYIMIDEFQDTNRVQSELTTLLSAIHGNLFVVGDDDQSIYSWRGALVKNILQFNYKTLVKLEQNYRSTKPILDVANALIDYNKERHSKALWSEVTHGDKVHVFHAPDEQKEAQGVIDRILKLKSEKHLRWSDCAILYRANKLSKPFEMALIQAAWKDGDQFVRGIPYRVIQGMEFYERAEIKDFLAYLKTIINPKDQQAVLRIINYPRRGIAVKTLETLKTHQKQSKISFWSALKQAETLDITNSAKKGVAGLVSLIESAKQRFSEKPLKETMLWFMQELALKQTIKDEFKSEKAQLFKWENLQSLASMAEDFNGTLSDFISTTMLDQNRKTQQGDSFENRVNLLTFHSAKGLEFKACFIVGLEDKILPHERSLAENGLEEERRLFYVALTRAQRYLTLSMAQKRNTHGKENPTNPSRFLFEIPKELLHIVHWNSFNNFAH